MLQRNVSGSPLLLPTLEPPIEVPPGGEIDHPDPLAGFIPVQDESTSDTTPASGKTAPPSATAPDPGSKPRKNSGDGESAGSDEGATA